MITLALRTPLCKYKKGGLRDTPLDALVFKTLEQVRLRSNLDPALVGDICLGNVRDGRASYYCRVALLGAGFPNTTCGSHASRFCSSGLTAAQHIANEIITGTIEVGIAVGAESLSEGNERLTRPFDEEIRAASDEAKDCEVNMGVTSENVANDFNISRQMQVLVTRHSFLSATTDSQCRISMLLNRIDVQKLPRRMVGLMMRLHPSPSD